MHPCYFIVKDSEMISTLRSYVELSAELCFLGSYSTMVQALSSIVYFRPAIIFIDIDLAADSPSTFAKLHGAGMALIVISRHSHPAIEAVHLSGAHLLQKPISLDVFSDAVKKALEKIILGPLSENLGMESLFITTGVKGRMVQVTIAEIYYLEAIDHSVHIYLLQETHVVKSGLAHFLSKLPSTGFIRIHRSFAVNIIHIRSIEKNFVVLKSLKKLPLSDRCRTAMLEKIKNRMI